MENGYVFISYSSMDNSFVQKLTDALDFERIPYWKAPEWIPAGSNYAKEIPKAISGCDIFLLVLSKTSQQSIWVEKEIDLAICCRKTIIPVQIDEEPLNDMYRFYLNNVQMISMWVKENLTLDFTEIQKRIIKLLNTPKENEKDINDITLTRDDNKGDSQKSTKRSNALRINRIPHECEFCGGDVEQDSMGVYLCKKCGRENYDDFQKIRNYLEKAGAAPAVVISRNTKVPLKTIEYFWKEEFLEIPKAVDVRISCQSCGAPIRTGYLCDLCKKRSFYATSKKDKGNRQL